VGVEMIMKHIFIKQSFLCSGLLQQGHYDRRIEEGILGSTEGTRKMDEAVVLRE